MISFTRYVDITSGVLGSGAVKTRELILRIFTANPLMPSNSFVEFTTYAEVLAFFGSTSNITKRAAAYFGFLSKLNSSPQKMSVASWVQVAVPARIYGAPSATASLTALKTITSGNLALTINGIGHTIATMNFSGAANLAAIATILQTAVRAADADTNWSAATVTYDATRGAFNLVGGVASPASPVSVAVAAATSVDAGVALGWEDVTSIFSFGSAAQSLTTTLAQSTAASNNFATFSFDPTLNDAQLVEIATWNQTENNMFVFLPTALSSTAAQISSELIGFPGIAVTLSPLSTEFPELLPAMIAASTDYENSRNVSQNYMFQQANLTPSVNTDAEADAYDPLRINYYGVTQTAGQQIAFYQRGVLMGGGNSPTDIGIYVNEIWLKSSIGAAIMSLFLALPQISANAAGRATLVSTILSVITKALFNGVISVGTTLNNTQIQSINLVTGNQTAWRQVQTIGYWLDVEFGSNVTIDSRTEYFATYTLVYKKNDAIRKVQGTHDLV